MEIEEKPLCMSTQEQQEFDEADRCHICKGGFLPERSEEEKEHLEEMKDWLLSHELPLTKIPFITNVKRANRKLVLELHPDKVGDERMEE